MNGLDSLSLDERIKRVQARNALLSVGGFLSDEQRDELGDLYRQRHDRDVDRALCAFLDREDPVDWTVRADGDFLEVAIWKGDDHEYGGVWRVAVPDGTAERFPDA